jgi:hypothetical protein
MDERSFWSIWERKMVIKDEINDAEYHDQADDSGCRSIDCLLALRELYGCRGHHIILPLYGFLKMVISFAQKHSSSANPRHRWE